MAEYTEIQSEELTGSELDYWTSRESFTIEDARFLLNDYLPKALMPRQRLPRRITDTERGLREWLSSNGHSKFLEKTVSRYQRNEFNREFDEIKETISGGPIPRDILMKAAETLCLKPRFLFPGECQVKPVSTSWPWGKHETKLLRHLKEAAERFWVRYDPAEPSTAVTNQVVSEWLEKRGVSKRTAEVMASILRADGLPDGRRK